MQIANQTDTFFTWLSQMRICIGLKAKTFIDFLKNAVIWTYRKKNVDVVAPNCRRKRFFVSNCFLFFSFFLLVSKRNSIQLWHECILHTRQKVHSTVHFISFFWFFTHLKYYIITSTFLWKQKKHIFFCQITTDIELFPLQRTYIWKAHTTNWRRKTTMIN